MAAGGSVLRTLLLTDLVNSTKLLEQLGDQRAFEIFGRHDRIARDLLSRYDGKEIDKTDGFLFLFERPIDALGYALDYHRALAELSEEVGVRMEARAGIHLGEVFLRENSPEDVAKGAKPLEVEGLAKPMAARLMSLAGGRQTLMTRGAYDLARRAAVDAEDPDRPFVWMAHGLYAFKGVDDPIRVFEVGIQGESALSAPADSAKVWQVARKGLRVAELKKKRRRMILAAAGAMVLLLAAISLWHFLRPGAPEDPRKTVAVLGFANLSGLKEADWLSTALSETINTDLASSKELRILPGEAVSRARQDLKIVSVQTLGEESLKLLRRRLGADYLVSGSYLRSRSQAKFGLTASLQDASSGEILASEKFRGTEEGLFDLASQVGEAIRSSLGLAAAPEAGIHLEASLPSSASGSRFYAQGLEALRSYEPQKAASLFEQAVAMDPEAPLVQEALAAAWSALGYDSRAVETAEKAWKIAENSKVLPREQRLLIEARYAQTTGKWTQAVEAYQKLFNFDEMNLEYGLQLAAAEISAASPEVGLKTLKILRRFPVPEGEDPRIDIQEARAAGGLSRYEQQLESAHRAMQKAEEIQAPELQARAAILSGQALHRLGRRKEAAEDYALARKLYQSAGNTARVAQAINLQAILRWQAGDFEGAAELFRQSLNLCKALGDRGCQASAEGNLASLWMQKGDLEAAGKAYSEALKLFREVGNRNYEAVALSNLGLLQSDLGRPREARKNLEEALEILKETGRRSSYAHSLYALGDVQLIQGEVEGAVKTHRKALEIREELEEPGGVAASRLSLANALMEAGQQQEALREARKAAEAFSKEKKAEKEARAHALSARIFLMQKKTAEAEAELGLARALRPRDENTAAAMEIALAGAELELSGGHPGEALKETEGLCEPSDFRPACLEISRIRIESMEGLDHREQARGERDRLRKIAEEHGFGLVLKKLGSS